MLSLKNVHVYRGNTHVLNGVSLDVAQGEIVTLIGSNGAGKTTTLAAVSGLVDCSQGEIMYRPAQANDWESISGRAPEKIVEAGISHCPEGRQIFGDLNVRENLVIGAYLRSDKKAVNVDIDWINNLFPVLAERSRQPGSQLSGGEQMMLAVGRALMSRPRLLLLDEPSLGLAPQIVEQILDILRSIRNEGITVLLVEQNAAMALELADRGYVIETGEIVLSGEGSQLANDENVRKAYLGAA